MKKKLSYLIILLFIIFIYSGSSFLANGNESSAIESLLLTSTKIEQVYTYDINANDSKKDVLTYSLLAYPEGMVIDTLASVINWTLTKEQIVEHEVIVNVEDRLRNDTQNIAIETKQTHLTSIDVDPPIIYLTSRYSNLVAFNFVKKITANYDYGPSKSIARRDSLYETSNPEVATVSDIGIISAIAPGSAVITVSYTENGIKRSDTLDVIITSFPVGRGCGVY